MTLELTDSRDVPCRRLGVRLPDIFSGTVSVELDGPEETMRLRVAGRVPIRGNVLHKGDGKNLDVIRTRSFVGEGRVFVSELKDWFVGR